MSAMAGRSVSIDCCLRRRRRMSRTLSMIRKKEPTISFPVAAIMLYQQPISYSCNKVGGQDGTRFLIARDLVCALSKELRLISGRRPHLQTHGRLIHCFLTARTKYHFQTLITGRRNLKGSLRSMLFAKVRPASMSSTSINTAQC
jgi:hypothetical protein